MRVGIQAWGSEGDIRPLLALAIGLRSAGHDVTFAATSTENRDFGGLCLEHGVHYQRVPEEVRCDSRELGERIRSAPSRGKALRLVVRELYLAHVDEMHAAARRLCETNDIVVGHFTVVPLKVASLETRTPYVCVVLFRGCVPSLHLPPGRLPNLGPVGNWLEWRLVQGIVDHYLMKDVRSLWARCGLRPPRHVLPDAWESERLNLIGASSVFAPPQKDWGGRYRVCGYFHLPPQARLGDIPPGLREFLEEGEPPVYMTFGVLEPCYPERILELLLGAARLAGCRAVVQTSSRRHPSNTRGDRVYFIDRAPHHLVFPFCSAVVHHGGGGTAHSVTSCGRPSVVVGFSNEHMAYGRDLHRLGAGSAPLRFREATPERLAGRIRLVLGSPLMSERAAGLAEIMRGEDGVGCAVAAIGGLDVR